MEQKKKYLILAISIAVIIFALIFLFISQSPLKNLKYVNSQFGFGFNPPKNWTLEHEYEGSVYYHYYDGDIGGKFSIDREVQIGISVVLLPKVNYTAQSYYEGVLQNEIQNDPNNITLISYGERMVNGIKAYEIIYVINNYYNSPYNKTENQQAKLIFLESKNKIVSIDYRTIEFLYDEYNPIVEQCIKSIIVT
jgi:hypothetical protein